MRPDSCVRFQVDLKQRSGVHDALRQESFAAISWHFAGQRHSSLQNGEQSLGGITYEIDGYCNQFARSANGQIEGEDRVLTQAFQAGVVSILLSDGSSIEVVLADPHGGSTAEVQVNGNFPL